MASSDSYEKFVNLMTEDILSKLDGTHKDFKRLQTPDKPSKRVILGTLGNRDSDYSAGKAIETRRTLTSVKNNSLSVKFLVKEKKGIINIKPQLSTYYEVYPTFTEQKTFFDKKYKEKFEKISIARIWERKNIKINSFNADLSKEINEHEIKFSSAQIDIKSNKNLKGTANEINHKFLENETVYYQEINSIPKREMNFNWKAAIKVYIEDFKQQNDELYLVTVTILNETEENNDYETFLFNCNLEIELNDVKLTPFNYKYEYEGYDYSHNNHIRCLNCHAIISDNIIKTKHYCDYSKEKIIPRTSVKNLSLNFKDLSVKDDNLSLLKDLGQEMDNLLNYYKKNSQINDKKYMDSIKNFEKSRDRYFEGFKTLENNEKALKSFELVNKTLNYSNPYDGWRIFQIVFLVSMIPDIINKDKRRELCEILHVPTGGGKSEAYFGCVLFSAFWDRLNGKKFGITAITKFPLRMLSIQQLQRISELFIWAEKIRKEEKIGGNSFSVGYFVGSSEEFPRKSYDLIRNIKNAKKDLKEIPGKIITKCPLCKNGKVILDYRDESGHIIHKCTNIECLEEFEIYFTDEEIYRALPTFIISTVDKLAGISTNRRFRNLFGGKIDLCPNGHGYIPHNDTCEFKDCNQRGNRINIDFSIAPSIIIQDEMHLIREGFGTINSHFESLMETLQKEIAGYGFKNIAMTATITGAKEQIKNLYNKEINIFPAISPEGMGINDFFFKYEKEQGVNVTQRYLIGLKPNFRDNQYASLLTIRYISEFIKNVETNLEDFSFENDIELEIINEIISNYKNILTYHNKKSDVHSMNYYLESVVNTKLDSYKVNPKILTGENTIDEIKDIIKLVNTYFDEDENKENLLSVFATSIVSHGVDIDKWNIMIFQGIPRSTAEYIQALSRVGRKYLGIVFVWFYPNRTRDLSFYQNFFDYHEFLDHKVEYVPLSRWTKLGFKQTFTSIFSASIINYFSELLNRPLYKVDDVNEIFSQNKNREKLIDFINKAYVSNSDMIGSNYFKKEIPNETEERLNYLATYTGSERNFFPNALKDSDEKYYKTQYGMRGIQDEIRIKPNGNDIRVLQLIERNYNE